MDLCSIIVYVYISTGFVDILPKKNCETLNPGVSHANKTTFST